MSRLIVVLAALLGGGCATANGDPRDPFEDLNRFTYGVNDKVDRYALKPVSRVYHDYLPTEFRDRVRNFFANIADPMIGVNNMLQGKFEDGFFDWVRFGFNSTFGLFGLHDIASDMGYEKHNEDWGQTFGRWGAGSGPYIVLPFLGSSSVRDGIGTGFDFLTDPMAGLRRADVRWGLWGVRVIQVRSDLLDVSQLLEEAALDKYVFQRDAYFQRRRSLIYDGQPPREREPASDSGPEVNAPPGRDVDNIPPGEKK